jgi:hypothetical protein
MCHKRNTGRLDLGYKTIRIDPCMKFLIKSLNNYGMKTVACCCGHGYCSPTVVVEQKFGNKMEYFDLFSGIHIPRKKRFYKKDALGFYYIPEVEYDNIPEIWF